MTDAPPPRPPGEDPQGSLLDEAAPILETAEGLSGEARETYLHEACGSSPELLRLVRSLLADVESARGFLGAGPGDQLRARLEAQLSGDAARPAPGATIGGYRIVKVIASGGMGTVYEAEQSFPRRHVALKVVAPGMATSEGLRRFRLEGEILASLSHPGIAKVLEVSAPDAPEPWFAMELVDGLRLTDHARERRLTIHERLALLATTCDAVAHAHSRGIVHRDLKPSNILVDGGGHPKVLDFGVARATALQDRASTLLTRTGDLVGTLAYMSPEQAWGRQEQVDARSDVYSLGVIGFELLTGRLPRRLDNLALGEALHVLREGEPDRADSIDPSLKGDVATLLAKALDPDPARRYASASELAADIRRCLRDEPIVARPPSAAYRATKFLRRHRTLALTTTAAFVLLSVVAALAMRSAVNASRASRVAATEAYRANLAAAASEIETGGLAVARGHLEAVPEARRAWEWRVLHARIGEPTTSAPLGGFTHAAISPDGRAVHVTSVLHGDDRLLTLALPGLRVLQEHDLRTRPLRIPREAVPLALRTILSTPSTGGDETLEIVATGSGADEILRFRRPNPFTGSIAEISPDGRHAVIVDVHGAATLADLLTGETLAEAPSVHAAFDPSGDRVAWSQVTRLDLADARSGAVAFAVEWAPATPGASTIAEDDGFMRAAFSADGSSILVGSYGAAARVRRLDARSGELLSELHVRAGTNWGVDQWAISEDGSRAAWSPGDGSIHVFDGLLKKELGIVHAGRNGWLNDIALSPDGSRLVGLSPEAALEWDLSVAMPQVVVHAHESYVYSVSYSPDGSRFVTAGWDDRVRVWDAETLQLRLDIPFGHDGLHPVDAAFTRDGTRLVMTLATGDARVADADTGATLLEARSSVEGTVQRWLDVDPRGELVMIAQPPRGVLVLRLSDLAVAEGHEHLANGAAWSPDGGTLAAGLRDGGAALIDRASGARIPLELPPTTNVLRRIRWSPDGARVLAAMGDGTVHVLDGIGGRRIMTLAAPGSGEVFDAVASPDGTRIASASRDGAVRIWDAGSGELLASWRGHGLYAHGLSFSPDGSALLSCSGDRTVRRWDARTQGQRAAALLESRER